MVLYVCISDALEVEAEDPTLVILVPTVVLTRQGTPILLYDELCCCFLCFLLFCK